MRTPRRAASITALAALALVLAACTDDTTPDEPSPIEPEVSISTPEGFTSDAPAWNIASDLPADAGTNSTISSDGEHYAYAQRGADTITIGQINLATGERAETSIAALSATDDGTNAQVSLQYSGSRLVVAHSGTSPTGDSQWSAALVQIGSASEPTVLTETTESGANIVLPSAASGPIITATKGESRTSYLVNPETASVREQPLGEPVSFEGCGDPTNCNIAPQPAVQSGGTTVATFREGASAVQPACAEFAAGASLDERSGFDHCLTGFMTERWSSQDPEIAPSGAIVESAYIYAAGDGYLIGSWRTEDGGTVFRTININEPGSAHAEVTCDRSLDGAGSYELHRSPSGRFVAAGSVLFDVRSGEGRCFDDAEVRLASVSDSGTAWGASGSSWTPSQYASPAVSVTMDGQVTPEGEGVAVPVSFVSANGVEAGAFAVSNSDLDGATVVGVYPVEG